ncbi:MAG: hypothetical protein INR65_17285 [Gluconacetobacter diazotrophicus]|nr:hypothetical protein [Gluconacetobacter diazotrophicus]
MAQAGQRRLDGGHPASGTANGDEFEPARRLEAALARIAAAAGRKQDALRVADLSARAAQHENRLLREAEARAVPADEIEMRREREARLAAREDELRTVAARLDALIAAVRGAVGDADAG